MHLPVLLQEVLEMLRPRSGGIYLDGTLGAGGYSEAILRGSAPDGKVFGLDLDSAAVKRVAQRLESFGDRFKAIHGGFQDAVNILEGYGVVALDGAVLDLGLSSDQLEDPSRGFSFRWDGPLDMRFDTDTGQSVLEYLQTVSAKKLEEILATYGEERYCKKLSRALVDAGNRGDLETTEDLVRVVTTHLGKRRGKIHPATRTFQALRIAVNREMENLSMALESIPALLVPGGRLCVVSYHSLEDRQVKVSFRERQKGDEAWTLVTPKPVRPSPEEVRSNPRSRSARLRAIEASGAFRFQRRHGRDKERNE